MNFHNLMILIEVFLDYTILVFGLSVFFLRPVLKELRFSYGFLACFLAGNFYVMNVTFFLLLFFHCANRLVTILILLLGAFLLRFLLNRREAGGNIREAWDKFRRLMAGTYGWHLFVKEQGGKIFENLLKGILFVVAGHLTEICGILLCLGIQAYYTGCRLVTHSGYGGYDEVVHAGWVQHMMNGEIYSSGVYPFGFHEMVYAVAKVFGMNAPQVVRNFGFVVMIYMTLMMYCLIADTLDNRIAAFLATFLYAGVNIYTQTAWDRCGFGFPQEFGAVFLYPMLLFLFLYLKEKKKFYLFFFGMGFSLTLYVHYYITIIALLLCFGVGIVFLVYMFRQKLLIPVLICGIAAGSVGAMTMVLGVATGHRLQGSLYWALGVITGSEEDEGEIGGEQDTGPQEVSVEGGTEEAVSGIILSGAGIVSEGTLISGGSIAADHGMDGTGSAEQKETLTLKQKILRFFETGKSMILRLYDALYHSRLYNCMTENSFWMFSVFTLITLVLAVFYLLSGKEPLKGAFILSFLLYLFFLDIMMASEELGLPTLIENYRVRVFLCYALPYVLAVPAGAVIEILEVFYGGGSGDASREHMVLRRAAMIPIAIFSVITLIRYDLNRYPGRSIAIQADAVVDVFYEIVEEYEPYTWTLVSDVQEYGMCIGNCYHYEWTDLLEKLSSGVTDIKIPTKYIFFAVEKRPIAYGTVFENGNEVPEQGDVSRYFAKQGFTYGSDIPYKEERMQVMSKAYYWARAYENKFPDEMKVFYEDKSVIYYCLTQDPYYLNNLKIEYGFNSIDVVKDTEESN